ncbi:MAG: hypothetical protein A2Y59_01340 [Chloroflexi bacterium RBG_13_52_14]|nr:MAG: hypothetical protein A2Y59_01340 [Chloroflexi bacterium RBG_13_52_14]
MKAHAGYLEKTIEATKDKGVYSRDVLAMKKCAEKIWNALSKYVVFEKDANLKDPNWPYI